MEDRTTFEEITRQIGDQVLHAMWGGGTGIAFGFGLPRPMESYFVAGVYFGIAVVSLTIFVVREYRQWPSSRWYDPYLDWAVFAVAMTAGMAMGATV